MAGRLAGRFLATFLQSELFALLTPLLACLQQQGGLIVQRLLACLGPVAGFFIGAQGAQFFDRPLYWGVGVGAHGRVLSPVFKVRDPGRQAFGQLSEPVGFAQFDDVQLQFASESDLGGVAVAHLEAPQGLFGLLFGVEQREVEQVDADHRLEPAVVLAGAQLLAQKTGQIQDPARAPGGEAAYLHFDIVVLLALVDGAQIQDQVFTAEPFGGQARVEEFDLGDRGFVAAQDVDQVDQQIRFFGEDTEEDVVVFGVE